jgi:hypothetical protein
MKNTLLTIEAGRLPNPGITFALIMFSYTATPKQPWGSYIVV